MQPMNTKHACLFGVLMIMAMNTHAAEGPPPRGRPDFFTMKQETIARLKSELACVEAAKDETALRNCRPRPPQGGPGGPGGPGNQSNSGSGAITDSSNKYNLPDF